MALAIEMGEDLPRPHRPYEGSQPACTSPTRPSKRSSSPLRGVATRPASWRPGPAPSSSSPLRGVATPGRPARREPYRRVLIAPTRGRNRSAIRVPGCWSASPHRPYEGSQHVPPPGGHVPFRRPHRPYEGSQRASAPRRSSARLGPHHPYEGSQRPVTDAVGLGHLSSSPLRGVATCLPHPAPRAGSGVLIAPTGGRNIAVETGVGHRDGSSSPLRGVATCGSGLWSGGRGRVLIAPARGRNMVRFALVVAMRVLIAPVRGRNLIHATHPDGASSCSSPL